MKVTLFILLSLLISSCIGPKIPLIGIDNDGKVLTQMVNTYSFSDSASQMLTDVQKDTLTILDQQEQKPGWELNHFQVGLLISMSVGPAVWKVGATPGFRLVFQKK